MKKTFCLLALAVAAILSLPSCDKEPEQKPAPIDPVKVLRFGKKFGYDSIGYDNVMRYANDPRITTIIYFMDSTKYNYNNNYTGYGSDDIPIIRNYLQERLNYTPKATGAGTFIFRPGIISVEDSLWFIQNGWKIRIY